MISEQTSVREIASLFPDAARVFYRAGIEYGCDGVEALADVCSKARADVGAVLRQIQALESDAPASEPGCDWSQETVGVVVSHILAAHHSYLKEELPRLEKLMNRVYETHGRDYPELLTVHELFFALKDELELHLRKEEMMLFPYLLALEAAAVGQAPLPACPFGTVSNPIRVMRREHDSAEDALHAIRAGTSDFTPPAGACLGFSLLLYGLGQLEADLRRHIWLENDLLFTKALQLEEAVGSVPPGKAGPSAPTRL